MRLHGLTLVVAITALGLAGCSGGGLDVDFSPQRDVSADISASLNHGPVADEPGMLGSEEPIGAMPWSIGERHQE